MAIEPKRGCGYRKVGGIYLVGDDLTLDACHRLPLPIKMAFFRGYLVINPYQEFRKCNCDPQHGQGCFVCNPPNQNNHGLMFVGESYYTPSNFIDEARRLGVSKRIPYVPAHCIPGHSIVYLAIKNMPFKQTQGTIYQPAVFFAFRIKRIEQLIWNSQATDEMLAAMAKKGLTPVRIPDGDRDHR